MSPRALPESTVRSIFRPAALQHHLQGKQRAVLPRMVSPPVFLCLWVLLALLVAAAALAWFARIPIYVPGWAVIVDPVAADLPVVADGVVAIAFLSPENLAQLRVGQSLLLQLDSQGACMAQSIAVVEPEIVSPELARQRFSLAAGAVSFLTRPAAVAMAPVEITEASLPASAYLGSVYTIEVEIGSRRAISFLPWIGAFFAE